MNIKSAIAWLVGIAIASFIGGYFTGMGSSAWRVSEQSFPGIITGSIFETENSSIATRKSSKNPAQAVDDRPILERWFGKPK